MNHKVPKGRRGKQEAERMFKKIMTEKRKKTIRKENKQWLRGPKFELKKKF